MPISRRGQIFALAVFANIFAGTANIFGFEATATVQLLYLCVSLAQGPDADTTTDNNTDTNTQIRK